MKNIRLIVFIAVSSVILIILALNTNTGVQKLQLDGQSSLNIANARLASANNALSGDGNFSEEDCNALGKLAKKINSSNDYIQCSSPKLIYLDTPDTSDKNVLILSDDKYTATFTTDKESSVLLDYSFKDSTSGGFNNYGGRK